MAAEANGSTGEDAGWQSLQDALVDDLVARRCINDPRIEAAFRAVPRHLFLPGIPIDQAYKDAAITTKQEGDKPISSGSQPTVVAMMLEQLEIEPGGRVLEIGAGTGYNAALMAYLAGNEGAVDTVDIDEDIVEQARKNLAEAGVEGVHAVCDDGGYGYPPGAPYDRIILTVGAGDIAPAWIEQLAPRGRLVIPLSLQDNGVAKSIAFEQRGDCLESISIKDCGFIMLRGRYATAPPAPRPLGPGLLLSVAPPASDNIDPAIIQELLDGQYQDISTSINATGTELGIRFTTWMSLQPASEAGPAFGSLVAMGEAADSDLAPFLLGIPGRARSTMGLFDEDGMALLLQKPGGTAPPVYAGDETSFEVYVRSFGQTHDLAQRLVEKLSSWDRAGRPPDPARLRIRACPKDYEYKPGPNELLSEKPNVKLVIQW